MLTRLRNYLNPFGVLSDKELAVIKAYATPRRTRKRQFILQEGDVCNHFILVTEGCLGLLIPDEEDKDCIVDFALENEGITDYTSLTLQQPTCYCIMAIEDTKLLMLDRTGMEKLTREVPQFWETILCRFMAQYQTRMTFMVTMDAEEKYRALSLHRPNLIHRLPLHMIASYLGITPTSLSRLRKNQTERN